jgi:sugar lactone lactonase YvrE
MSILLIKVVMVPILFAVVTACSTSADIARMTDSVNVSKVLALDPIQLPSGFQYPNGITRASDGTLYVGSITSGQILQISPTGKRETLFPGNNEVFAATSLRLDESRDLLWGASPDFLGTQPNSKTPPRSHRIFAINLRSGKIQQVIQMPEGGFGNDLAIDAQGGVYLTDSARPRIYYLPLGATQLQTWIEDQRLQSSHRIGLSGIALRADGSLVVNRFGDGKFFKITPQFQGKPAIEEIVLARPIENPDGIQWALDGSLLIVEGAVKSGKGRLLRVDTSDPIGQPKSIETLAENLVSPVNLTTAGNEVWVTESQIRHRLLPGKEKEIPDRFFIRHLRVARS